MATKSPLPSAGEPCPTCGFALVTEKGAVPWCANCGWNLDYFDADRRRPEIGWRWVDRATFRTAYDLNSQEFATLSGRQVDRIGYSWIKALMTAISIGLLALVVAMAAFGVWVMVDLHNVIGYIFGGVLLCVAGALRPRFDKLDKLADPISESQAPALHRLIREVAIAIGAPVPHTVLWSTAFNASSSAYGVRRRRVVSIGLPLWISLTPQQRVALLGHELGQFVNGDVRRGPLTGLVFRTFDTLSMLTRPDRGTSGRYGRGAAGIADVLARLVMSFLHTMFWVAQLAVDAVAMRATHRAAYAADQIASSVGGSEAASGLFDVLLLGEPCVTVLRRAARTEPDDPQAWHKAVATSLDSMSPRLPRLRQLSMREQASLFRTHPPAGLRAQMMASRPQTSAKVVLTESDALRIDQELAKQFRSMRSTLIN